MHVKICLIESKKMIISILLTGEDGMGRGWFYIFMVKLLEILESVLYSSPVMSLELLVVLVLIYIKIIL